MWLFFSRSSPHEFTVFLLSTVSLINLLVSLVVLAYTKKEKRKMMLRCSMHSFANWLSQGDVSPLRCCDSAPFTQVQLIADYLLLPHIKLVGHLSRYALACLRNAPASLPHNSGSRTKPPHLRPARTLATILYLLQLCSPIALESWGETIMYFNHVYFMYGLIVEANCFILFESK